VKGKIDTVQSIVNQVCPESRFDQAVLWPPDAFAIAGWLLQSSGTYSLAVHDDLLDEGERVLTVLSEGGKKWRRAAATGEPLPAVVERQWKVVREHKQTLFHEVPKTRELVAALLNIVALADEACHGVALPRTNGTTDLFYETAVELLAVHPETLCQIVPPTRVRVLPKVHTPQVGLTLRNLTHYLALCPGGEVSLGWYFPGSQDKPPSGDTRLNLLLIPHPLKVSPHSFKAAATRKCGRRSVNGEFGFFNYDPGNSHKWLREEFPKIIRDAIESLKVSGEELHGVILPECSLNGDNEAKLAIRTLNELSPGTFLVTGVAEPPSHSGKSAGMNSLYYSFPMSEMLLGSGTNDGRKRRMISLTTQAKHHRWKLDSSQIKRYALDLDDGMKWWEHINVKKRELHFFAARNNLTFCFLICEDLARQEPVAPVVRAVAPHLVIALLQDGPQLESRWAARYASVLADDPGSSVLTLTSAGMAHLGNPKNGASTSTRRKIKNGTVVGLWRDQLNTQLLSLSDNSRALLLRLRSQRVTEYSTDGRRNESASILKFESSSL
jgi:hypothetical protein